MLKIRFYIDPDTDLPHIDHHEIDESEVEDKLNGGVLLLRLADDRTITKLRVIQAVLAQYEGQLANTFVVATERHIRIRKPV